MKIKKMEQDRISKITAWIRNNRNYPLEQLRQSAYLSGASESEFESALDAAFKPSGNMEYRGVGIRFFAIFLDAFVYGSFFWIIIRIFGGTYAGGCDSSFSLGTSVDILGSKTFYGLCGFSAEAYFILIIAYHVIMEWKFGGTIGKLMTGIRVVRSTGEPLDFKSALIRNLLRIIDFLFFYLVAAVSIWNSKTKQRIGDRLAKTVVISKFKN